MARFRRNAAFVAPHQCVGKLDRNARARIIHATEIREVRSKKPGKKDGDIGQSGLRVLRVLLNQFHNRDTGRCDPSYTGIQARTGLCRDAVAHGLERLEAAGVITIIRRLKRDGWRVLQMTNAYLFEEPNPSHPPSLPSREKPSVPTPYPYKRPSALLSVPMSKALEALGDRVAEQELLRKAAVEGTGG